MKKDVDLFGLRVNADPPRCYLTVYATTSPHTTTVAVLSYCLPLIGVSGNTKEIYIVRSLETVPANTITTGKCNHIN